MICLEMGKWGTNAGPSPPSFLLFEVIVALWQLSAATLDRNLQPIIRILETLCLSNCSWVRDRVRLTEALAGLLSLLCPEVHSCPLWGPS